MREISSRARRFVVNPKRERLVGFHKRVEKDRVRLLLEKIEEAHYHSLARFYWPPPDVSYDSPKPTWWSRLKSYFNPSK